jgi:hypothetical protein
MRDLAIYQKYLEINSAKAKHLLNGDLDGIGFYSWPDLLVGCFYTVWQEWWTPGKALELFVYVVVKQLKSVLFRPGDLLRVSIRSSISRNSNTYESVLGFQRHSTNIVWGMGEL